MIFSRRIVNPEAAAFVAASAAKKSGRRGRAGSRRASASIPQAHTLARRRTLQQGQQQQEAQNQVSAALRNVTNVRERKTVTFCQMESVTEAYGRDEYDRHPSSKEHTRRGRVSASDIAELRTYHENEMIVDPAAKHTLRHAYLYNEQHKVKQANARRVRELNNRENGAAADSQPQQQQQRAVEHTAAAASASEQATFKRPRTVMGKGRGQRVSSGLRLAM